MSIHSLFHRIQLQPAIAALQPSSFQVLNGQDYPSNQQRLPKILPMRTCKTNKKTEPEKGGLGVRDQLLRIGEPYKHPLPSVAFEKPAAIISRIQSHQQIFFTNDKICLLLVRKSISNHLRPARRLREPQVPPMAQSYTHYHR